MQENNKNSLIPASIIVAGLLIAGGIYFSNKPNTPVNQNQPVKISQISLRPVDATDHLLGNPNAPITVVEFSDPECPFCKNFQTTMLSVMGTYGKDGRVAWVYRHFPIDSLHSKARKEAEASECANELGGNTGFWKFIDEVFATTTSNNTLDPAKLPIIAKDVGLDVTKFNACLASGKYASTIQAGIDEAVKAGAQGTPYSVIVLKNPISTSTENGLNDYLSTSGLSNYVNVTDDKKEISLNGALPTEVVTKIIDILLK